MARPFIFSTADASSRVAFPRCTNKVSRSDSAPAVSSVSGNNSVSFNWATPYLSGRRRVRHVGHAVRIRRLIAWQVDRGMALNVSLRRGCQADPGLANFSGKVFFTRLCQVVAQVSDPCDPSYRRPKTQCSAECQPMTKAPSKPHRLLIADPDPSRRRKLLADLPHVRGIEAASMSEAFDLAEAQQPDSIALAVDLSGDPGLAMFLRLTDALSVEFVMYGDRHLDKTPQIFENSFDS